VTLRFASSVSSGKYAYIDDVSVTTTCNVDVEKCNSVYVGLRTPAEIMAPFAAYPHAPAASTPAGKYEMFTYDCSLNANNGISTGTNALWTTHSLAYQAVLNADTSNNGKIIRFTNDTKLKQSAYLGKKLVVGLSVKEISIEYYRMDRKWVTHRLRPATVMFTDYYFYLIAFVTEGKTEKPYYFRIDRIKQITIHRKNFATLDAPTFDEGLLRKRSLFMWPGKLQTIRFEFNGPSVQAVLDKLPTARIIERMGGRKYLIEAEVYGDGIKMWLLSQGAWVKVVSPDAFVSELRSEIKSMLDKYR
jgi:hypothetical protein